MYVLNMSSPLTRENRASEAVVVSLNWVRRENGRGGWREGGTEGGRGKGKPRTYYSTIKQIQARPVEALGRWSGHWLRVFQHKVWLIINGQEAALVASTCSFFESYRVYCYTQCSSRSSK